MHTWMLVCMPKMQGYEKELKHYIYIFLLISNITKISTNWMTLCYIPTAGLITTPCLTQYLRTTVHVYKEKHFVSNNRQ